jgi:ABC-2 type transport system permease protein
MTQFAALSTATAKEWSRDKVGLFFSFLFPLVFLLIFGLLFQSESYEGRPYIDFIAPGVMCWAVANGALFGVAYSIMSWRQSHLLRLIRMTPTSVPTVLGSRFLVSVGSGLLQALFFLVIAVLPFLGLTLVPQAVVVLLPLFCGIVAFFALGLLVGTYAKSPEAVAAIGNIIILPMAFLSGTFYPVSGLPRWLQIVSEAFPLRHMIDGVSGVLSGARPAHAALLPAVVLLGFAALFSAFATKLFRWSNEA